MKNRKTSSNWQRRKKLAQCFFTGTSKETGGLLGEAEKGTKERLHVARGWGKSSLGITVPRASLEQPVESYFFEQLTVRSHTSRTRGG